MPAVAAVPLLPPNEAGFTVKAPKLETSKEFQGNGDRTLFFLNFLIPTAIPLKDSVFLDLPLFICHTSLPLEKTKLIFFSFLIYICCFFIISHCISAHLSE